MVLENITYRLVTKQKELFNRFMTVQSKNIYYNTVKDTEALQFWLFLVICDIL